MTAEMPAGMAVPPLAVVVNVRPHSSALAPAFRVAMVYVGGTSAGTVTVSAVLPAFSWTVVAAMQLDRSDGSTPRQTCTSTGRGPLQQLAHPVNGTSWRVVGPANSKIRVRDCGGEGNAVVGASCHAAEESTGPPYCCGGCWANATCITARASRRASSAVQFDPAPLFPRPRDVAIPVVSTSRLSLNTAGSVRFPAKTRDGAGSALDCASAVAITSTDSVAFVVVVNDVCTKTNAQSPLGIVSRQLLMSALKWHDVVLAGTRDPDVAAVDEGVGPSAKRTARTVIIPNGAIIALKRPLVEALGRVRNPHADVATPAGNHASRGSSCGVAARMIPTERGDEVEPRISSAESTQSRDTVENTTVSALPRNQRELLLEGTSARPTGGSWALDASPTTKRLSDDGSTGRGSDAAAAIVTPPAQRITSPKVTFVATIGCEGSLDPVTVMVVGSEDLPTYVLFVRIRVRS
jgi:hypothetical protein